MNSPNLTTVLPPGEASVMIRAAQPLGACPGGRAPRQNWGKFKAHKWGGFTGRLEQDRIIAERSGNPTLAVKSIRRSSGK